MTRVDLINREEDTRVSKERPLKDNGLSLPL